MNVITTIANEKDLKELYECIVDAKLLFKSKGSSQWQDYDGYPSIETISNDLINNIVIKALDTSIKKIIGIVVLSEQEEECYKNIVEGHWLTNNHYLTLHRIAIKKEYYHLGIGTLLVEEAKRIALKLKINSIKADTMENNTNMRNLLLKCGFEYCGKIFLLRKDVIDKERLAYEYKH